MRSIRLLASSTYGEITRRPLYYILLVSFGAAIFLSKLLTLFSFDQEVNMVREMGMATLTFWAFIIILITSGMVVTQELEDRTAVTLLSKPIRRSDFLLGKFLGIFLAIIPGLFVLSGILFLTLWLMAYDHVAPSDPLVVAKVDEGATPFSVAWGETWDQFVVAQGGVVLQGAFLSLLQAAILAALAVSFSAFLPMVVSVAATVFLFILGSISGTMVSSLERLDAPALVFSAKAASAVLPNLGYFNLQTHFSEGTIITLRYLGLAAVYAALYVGAVFWVSCSLFRRREIR